MPPCEHWHHVAARPTRGRRPATVAFLSAASAVLDRGPSTRPRASRSGSSLEHRHAKRTPGSRGRRQRRRRCRRGGGATLGHSKQGVDGGAGGCCRSRRGQRQAGADSGGLCPPSEGGSDAREGKTLSSQRSGRQRGAQEREVESRKGGGRRGEGEKGKKSMR